MECAPAFTSAACSCTPNIARLAAQMGEMRGRSTALPVWQLCATA